MPVVPERQTGKRSLIATLLGLCVKATPKKTWYLDVQAECCPVRLSWKLKHVPQPLVVEIPAGMRKQ